MNHKRSENNNDNNDGQSAVKETEPIPEWNILLVGETGVGKSTFINALVNYISFPSMDEALNGEMKLVIPCRFSVMDENYETKEIFVKIEGMEEDKNEQLKELHQSATQFPKAYEIPIPNVGVLRIIDTPGIGDSRGPSQDKQNIANIMGYLNSFPCLHGICILLKPNQTKLTTQFEYIFKEILKNLHRSAANNICFCFTNTHGTFYKPGDTIHPLKELLGRTKASSGIDIPADKTRIYCFDNEAFRFLAALHAGVTLSDKEAYSGSWEKAYSETQHLLDFLMKREPHDLANTMSINSARLLLSKLIRPLSDIKRSISVNILELQNKKKEINALLSTGDELKAKLEYQEEIPVNIPLEKPCTVCTNKTCVKVVGRTTVYSQVCHPGCNLNPENRNLTEQPVLQQCWAMNGQGNCNQCDHSWREHMHITYRTEFRTETRVNRKILKQFEEKKNQADIAQNFLKSLEKKVEELESEKKTITYMSANLAGFLNYYAITPVNDALESMLIMQISNLEIGSKTEELRQRLEADLREYRTERESFDVHLKNSEGKSPPLTLDKIHEFVQQLYSLKHNGKILQNLMESVETSHNLSPPKSRTERKPEVVHIEETSYWDKFKGFFSTNKAEMQEKAIREKMRPEIDTLFEIAQKSATEFLEYIYQKYPPHRDYPIPKNKPIEKLLVIAISQYHPDKQSAKANDRRWGIICEEITKLLNKKHQETKK
mmetsp:Transcript_13849/g.19227  ORF Transcript_13849/g.19227 Transcript_13849/m.19227 type:complete len:718 (+) Transcript_13849:1479-3632(+)|eukprot:CAMPEP_0168547296 /NCGR_PEP_ID=MMETSP0413-20121227/3958_1 /TAXON_ID=136452 /ORGANISM="Filamoeba nolandi, Strain NC-AS-23-1" /LENGTH=717 /DNA_ID=CAMNT_0008577535 /DNA_START=4045 /DNA_END=6198 /DNA_ORIENTATION=+